MARITALRSGRGQHRLKLFLDGKPAFSLEAEVAAKENLQLGQELSDGQIEGLARSNESCRCFNTALHLLGYRPRGESELRQRLTQRGFDSASVAETVTKLKEQGLIDDAAFVRFWKENRECFSPRSRCLIRMELLRKGVAASVIDQALDGADDTHSAYRVAQRRAHRMDLVDHESFRRRLGEYLRRRGFNWEVINLAVERIWRERETR